MKWHSVGELAPNTLGPHAMNLFSKNARLDRPRFWIYIVLLWAAKAAWVHFNTRVARLPIPIDTVIIILIALVVGARFRDIGWRVWIGLTLVILLMLILPATVAFGMLLFVEDSELPSTEDLFSLIGLFTLGGMAVLLIIAGSKRSNPALTDAPAR